MAEPKLHHHVPQHYQSGFARDGRVWVFDRVTGAYRRDQPKNVGAITHDYSITTENGTKDSRVEKFLARIEDEAKPILAALRDGVVISPDDKAAFSTYLGYFLLRGPRFQRMADNIADVMAKTFARFEFATADDVRQMMSEVPDLTDGERAAVDHNAMFAFIKSERWTTHTNRQFVIKMMMEDGMKMQNYFRQMDWLVLHSDRRTAFLTTDNPLVIVPGAPRAGDPVWFRRDGVISPGALKLFPLASDSCLVMRDRGEKLSHATLPADGVRLTNIEVVGRCERLVIGRDEEHVRNLVRKTGVDRIARTPIFDAGSPPSR